MKTLTHDFIKDLPREHVENLTQYEECATCGAMGRNLKKFHPVCLGPRDADSRTVNPATSRVVKPLS